MSITTFAVYAQEPTQKPLDVISLQKKLIELEKTLEEFTVYYKDIIPKLKDKDKEINVEGAMFGAHIRGLWFKLDLAKAMLQRLTGDNAVKDDLVLALFIIMMKLQGVAPMQGMQQIIKIVQGDILILEQKKRKI